MKRLWALFGFVFAVIFTSALTTGFFIKSLDSGYMQAKLNIQEKSSSVAEASYAQFYSQLTPEQKQSFSQFNQLTPSERKEATLETCRDPEKKSGPYCSQKFLSGESAIEAVMKDSSKQQVEQVMFETMDKTRESLSVFTKYPLVLISILAAILSLLFYMFAERDIHSLQRFSGNVCWLSFLSAVSFKAMPSLMDKLISAQQQNVPAEAQSIALFAKEIIMSWLIGAMNSAFLVSAALVIISFIIWIAVKLYRNRQSIVRHS